MQIRQKGFTLIELLVVIAIIGILASIVLASLNTARDKGSDAAVKANINGTRAQAAIVYDNANSFAGVCSDANVAAAVTAADNANGAGKVSVCSADADEWVVSAQMKTSADYYCVDHKCMAAITSKSTYTTVSNMDCL